jgi:AcrR family transcriptional regulator
MDLAAHRFAAQGYHGTSVAEIVQGIGVGKGVFYWYFSSKEELFEEILAESQHQLRRAQGAAISLEADPVKRIEAGIRSSMQWLDANRHLFSLFQQAASEARFQLVLHRNQERSVSDLSRHIKDGIVEGRIRDADPEVLTHAVLGVINQLNRTFLVREDASSSELVDTAVAFCLAGLLGVVDGDPVRAELERSGPTAPPPAAG